MSTGKPGWNRKSSMPRVTSYRAASSRRPPARRYGHVVGPRGDRLVGDPDDPDADRADRPAEAGTAAGPRHRPGDAEDLRRVDRGDRQRLGGAVRRLEPARLAAEHVVHGRD